ESGWPCPGLVTPERWVVRRRDLVELSRFATGYLARGTPAWSVWLADLGAGWLGRRIEEWHGAEAVRLATCARWLKGRRPLLAVELFCRAVLACCERSAARAGLLYQ